MIWLGLHERREFDLVLAQVGNPELFGQLRDIAASLPGLLDRESFDGSIKSVTN
jgi:hypothetical protein